MPAAASPTACAPTRACRSRCGSRRPPRRVSAAAALEAVDQGVDAGRAYAAMKALSLAVYDHRTAR